MRVVHHVSELPDEVSCSVAIGNFDGCHLGHQRLLEETVSFAKKRGISASVLTFYPHPVEVLRPGSALERISTTSEKLALLEKCGIDLVLVQPFDQALAQLVPEEFFQMFLNDGFHARSVHVGFDFFFGKDRAGDIGVLKRLCEEQEMVLCVTDAVEQSSVKVSSSLIRRLIKSGELSRVAELLGRPYQLTGQVVPGRKLGRELGFPTANLTYAKEKVIPGNGVYVTAAWWQKQRFCSVTNVGLKPTLNQKRMTDLKVSVECHLIDFEARLYDESIRLDFLERIRGEKKFPSLEELKAQIQRDVDVSRQYFANQEGI